MKDGLISMAHKMKEVFNLQEQTISSILIMPHTMLEVY